MPRVPGAEPDPERSDRRSAAAEAPAALAEGQFIIDPLVLTLAHPAACAPVIGGAVAARELPPEVEHALTQVVRRIAWGGNGRVAAARIEFGTGAITVRVDGRAVTIDVDDAGGSDLGERVAARLRARGFDVLSAR